MEKEHESKFTKTVDHHAEPASSIIRRCPKCGKKTEFRNSGKFRVNANGRLIDVWLIYRCGQCETSWNMTIWERTEAGRLEKEEYEGFLQNDPELAEKYGNDRDLFARNKVEAAASKAEYHVTTMDTAFPAGRIMPWKWK